MNNTNLFRSATFITDLFPFYKTSYTNKEVKNKVFPR